MVTDSLTELISFPGGWLVGVTYVLGWGYQPWVVTPEKQVYTDGEYYLCSLVALGAARFLVEHSLEVE